MYWQFPISIWWDQGLLGSIPQVFIPCFCCDGLALTKSGQSQSCLKLQKSSSSEVQGLVQGHAVPIWTACAHHLAIKLTSTSRVGLDKPECTWTSSGTLFALDLGKGRTSRRTGAESAAVLWMLAQPLMHRTVVPSGAQKLKNRVSQHWWTQCQ